jgi:hypothetical protein
LVPLLWTMDGSSVDGSVWDDGLFGGDQERVEGYGGGEGVGVGVKEGGGGNA